MLTHERTLTFERSVPATPSELFRAFTHPAALRDWLCNAAQVEPRTGGRVYLWWDSGYYTAGVFTELTRNSSLAFTWRGPRDPQPSEVRVTISPAADGSAANLALEHSGIGSGSEWGDARDEVARLWETALDDLRSMLETGIDARLARRPMFGLSGGDLLTPEVAARLGVPVSEGVVIGGLVDGMAAQNAGLQKDDVVVKIGDYPISTFPSFGAALQHYQAGDRVPVAFYRGAEEQTLTLELSRRELPEVPETPQAAAEIARAAHQELNAELDNCFEGVTEEEAAYRRAPGEWSAKEVVAHLIASERDTHLWMAALIEDADVEQPFHSNGLERMAAIVTAYPALPALIEELKRSHALTAALAAAIPEETAAHKHSYYPLAQWLTTFAPHHREHFNEIRTLIAEARTTAPKPGASTGAM